jgi:hypothetical protein
VLIIFLNREMKPKSFPNDEFVIEKLNESYSKVRARKVLAVTLIDDRHAFVPFISNDYHYGISYWVWNKFKWKVARIDTRGMPHIWKLNGEDPSEYYIIWNMDPKDQIKQLDYFLKRERHASISQNLHWYTPAIQTSTTVSLEAQSYGAIPLPEEWVHIMSENLRVLQDSQPRSFFNQSIAYNPMYVGWIPYNQGREISFPANSVNGSSYTLRDLDLDYVGIMNEYELEQP